MSVFTALDLEEVPASFQLSAPPATLEPYGSGHINHSIRLTCTDGSRYLLQCINTGIFREPALLMENIERVSAHIASKVAAAPDADRRVLSLVRTHSGHTFHRQPDDSCWRIFRFVNRSRTFDSVDTTEQAFQAARAFGEFQQQLADLPADTLHETLPGFHDTPQRFAALERAIASDAAGRAASTAREIDFALQHKSLTAMLIEAGLPQRVIHNDCKLNNVLFDEGTGETLCVVDLDTVMPGLALYDFGDMVRTAVSPTAEDERDLSLIAARLPFFQALVDGYLSTAAFLTPQERELLPIAGQVITFEQGVRFLADHLNGDTYYKTQRTNHNLDRARTQFALLASLQQQESALRKLTANHWRGGLKST